MNSTNASPFGTVKKTARIAGFLYLLYILTPILAQLFAQLGFGDAAEIINVMKSHEGLFRLGFMMNIFSALLFLLAAWALYVLLKPVNKHLALLFVLLNLVGVAVECFGFLNLYNGWLLVSGADYLTVFPADQLQAMAMLSVNSYEIAHMIAQPFFAAWLFPLGYLVYRSGYLPRILGIVLMVECFAWLMYPIQFFLFPSVVIATISSAAGFIGEFSLTLWLLIMGAKEPQPTLSEVS
jgi:hypothetical protein